MKQTPEWFQAIRLGNGYIGGMHKILEERAGQRFSIKYRKATLDDCRLENDRCLLSFNFKTHFDLRPGTYTYLCEGDEYIMSDCPTEIFTNVEFISRAHGDVLIGGLGLGIMLKILQELPRVTSVTVIEKESEVISLVEDQLGLPRHIEVINADVFDWIPKKNYDVIYTDIYSDLSLPELQKLDFLENKFKKYLQTNGWVSSWRQK